MAKDDGVTSVVSITFFVDGVVAFSEISRDLERFLAVCDRWSMGYGMVWATEKFTIVQGRLANEVLYLSKTKLRAREEATYLGMTFESQRLSGKGSIERIQTAAKRLRTMKKSLSSRKLSIAAQLQLVRTFIVPMYEYGMHLVNWDDEILTEVDNLIDNGIRWVMGEQTPKPVTRARAALQVYSG